MVLICMLLFFGGAVTILLIAIQEIPPWRETTVVPPLVRSLVLHTQDVVESFVGYGSARPIHRVDIAAELSATVVERVADIREGSVVAEGQELFRLDDRRYQSAFARARALADAERATLEELAVEAEGLGKLIKTSELEARVARDEKARVTSLFERNLAAKKEYDFADLAYQQTQRVLLEYQLQIAKLAPKRSRSNATIRGYEQDAALARLDIERCEIKAPFAGHIESLFADVGDLVAPGTVLVTLIDPSRVEIPINLPASVHGDVVPGAECQITSESMRGSTWIGTIARVAPSSDEQTRTFAAYAVVDNRRQDRPLVPGAFVTARVNGPTLPSRLLVPRSAVRSGRVFVVENGLARVRSVTVDRYIEDNAMISGDLRDGDRIILTRVERLADGSPVRVRATESGEAHATTTLASIGDAYP